MCPMEQPQPNENPSSSLIPEEEPGTPSPQPEQPQSETQPTIIESQFVPSGSSSAPESVVDLSPEDEGPIPVLPEGEAVPQGPSWKIIALLSILTLIIIAAMSAFGGYRSGQQTLASAQTTQQYSLIETQFALGVEDLNAKRLNLARQRFEWVIEHDPSYPGVTDKLADVIMLANITATPTLAPTPTLTPTPDLRSVEEKYTQAQQLMAGADWDGAIDTLLRLRKENPAFHAIEIDGMLYVAFRNRGVHKIQVSDLEGGTYDLALAERFGPLDAEAKNWRSWAEYYITGASFWEVDWTKVIEYFSQLAPVVPNLMDGSGWTATDRLRIAYIRYGDQLAQAGEWCMAQEQYNLGMQIGSNPEAEPTATWVAEQCASGAEPEPTEGTITPEMTPTQEGGFVPVETAIPPTETITPTP